MISPDSSGPENCLDDSDPGMMEFRTYFEKNVKVMKHLYLFLMFLLFVPALVAGQTEREDEAEIREMMASRDEEIKDLLGPEGTDYTEEQREELQSMINDVIDFETMAVEALGPTYGELPVELQEEFVSLFSTIVRDQSLNQLDIYRADVSYELIEVEGDQARVNTIARLENVRTPVDYRMERRNTEWMITDMIIDEVSTVESYNRQFQSIIRQRGFDALMDSLRRRAARN